MGLESGTLPYPALPVFPARQGLTRVKNASDVVGVVLKELKRQSPQGSFRLLVAVDGVNGLWGQTALKKEDKSAVWGVPRGGGGRLSPG